MTQAFTEQKLEPSEEPFNSVRSLEECVGKDSPEERTHWASLIELRRDITWKKGQRETQERPRNETKLLSLKGIKDSANNKISGGWEKSGVCNC